MCVALPRAELCRRHYLKEWLRHELWLKRQYAKHGEIVDDEEGDDENGD
jgi:hypothetical protein